MRGWILVGLLALGLASAARAADLTVTIQKIDASGTGEAVGTVTITGGSNGAVFATDLRGLPAGQHGFHVHANADCGPGPNDQGQVVGDRHRGPRSR